MKLLYILKESLLLEIFDSPYNYKITSFKSGGAGGGSEVTYSFRDKSNVTYNVDFESTVVYGDWETSVSFVAKESLEMTNKYDIKVLSTVVAIITEYLKKFQPEFLEYEGVKEKEEEGLPSEERSKRAKIYEKMIDKLKEGFPEYDVSFDGSIGKFIRNTPRIPPSKGASSKDLKYFNHFDLF